MREAIRRWWEGVYENEPKPSRNAATFLMPYQKRHWTAQWTRTVLAFMRREWHKVLPILIGLAGLAIAYARLGAA